MVKFIRFDCIIGVALAVVVPSCRSQEAFPQWKVAGPFSGIEAQWGLADDVIVGDVSNVIAKGSQAVANPPWPVAPDIQEIYWCEADFRADAVVKGGLPPAGKKFLWAEIRPGCNIDMFVYGYGKALTPTTRVWFLRREGNYLRPVADAGGAYFIAFRWKWTDVPKAAVSRLVAALLLDPTALDLGPGKYHIALDSVRVARSILGDEELSVRLKALAAPPIPELHKLACDYLEAELRAPCK
jgi:hypothetical protein